jgi:hypothetical protein
MQGQIERTIAAARAVEFASRDQMSLGQLIDKLKEVRARNNKEDATVNFDFEYARPADFSSWRGVYAELALGFAFDGDYTTLDDLIARAERAVGHTYDGYKGGEFTMTRDTPVWVANYGNSGSTAVTGVYDDGWQVVLLTGYRPN